MPNDHSTLRILDANANRATEGLRVVEEYLRFELADPHLTECCKQLRHEVSVAIESIPLHGRLNSRDTIGDVGTQVSASDEFSRETTLEIWLANQKRVEQSLRCLEEFSKPLFPAAAATFEQLRYRTYTLAKAIDSTRRSRDRLAESFLYVLIDGGPDADAFGRWVNALVEAKVGLLQLRDKRLPDRELVERARQLRSLTRGTATQFIMNDRPDLAALADADGVHVGQDELKVADARAIVGPNRLIGVSTHSIQQARQAVLDGADYIGCGPTFPSKTKSFVDFPGLQYLRQVAAEITLPSFAIGGIELHNLANVLETGIHRVAVGNSVISAADPGTEARRFSDLLRSLPRSASR